jgi:FlaA1/EpsC-like NDP-sugar epimerase
MRPQRYFVAGLLDDDPAHYGVPVGRARVLGPVSMAPTCAERLRAAEIIVREDSVYGQRLRSLCDACAAINVRVRIAEDHSSADPQKKRLTVRPITIRDIELHDLLSRPHAHLDDEDFHVAPFIGERSVLVTGAGGSIGGEICRQLARFHPSKIVLVERSESALFEIHRDVSQRLAASHTELVPLLCDITHADRMAAAFSEHRPAVVIHAAAFKHLPLMESHPIEAIENNTLATVALAEMAAKHGVETFISLSTDKAVYPSSLMGASKLVVERFLEALGKGSKTKFLAVRFGNVLNSSGSAVPIFMEQLRKRQPITITNPSVRRYFLTGDEASQLVLLAGAIGKRSGVYVLEMGEPLSIVDLVGSIAFVMHVPQTEVQIEYCGLRPGEKIDEELFFADESHEQTASPFIMRAARPARPLAEVRQWLDSLRTAIAAGPDAAAAALMQIAVTASGPSPRKSAPENLTAS